ncbi:chitinase [Streptomyces rubellomurinus]|uniref:chitinase n=1 Tax=Streptomyces rubellomurinus (strain ATCC 31215) TaxID=359131 RepID=A0A0F2TFP6_STRR3|nr:glycosyl hydrolase family 18 protein [Streptomyces rubellomurinus]KJS61386.1 chitinase [Streptomyces rubellomurinus]
MPPARHRRPRAVHSLLAGASALVIGLAGLAVAGTGAHAADGELIANGGFETGDPSGWTCTGGTVQSTTAHTGRYALQSTPGGGDTGECTQTVAVKPSAGYHLSAWVQGSYVYLGARGTGGADPSTWTSSGGWTQLSTDFTTGPNTTSITVYLHGWYGQPAFLADDVSLLGPGGTPPSPSPTATATGSPSPTATATGSPSPTATATATATPTKPPGLPRHLLTGYWQNFDNGAAVQRIGDVPAAYDIIAVAFADATATRGALSFTLDPKLSSRLGGYTDAQFKADIAAKKAAGKKVVLSIGGQNGTVWVGDSSSAAAFTDSAWSLIQNYGFDGIDIDLENGIDSAYLGQALHALAAKAGSGFVLTMAPQTIDMQSTGTEYFKLALNVKDVLTIVNMQYYNSGAMNGCDGNVYSQGTENFLTALACIQLKGGLRPDQVGLGVPASTSAAGGGYVSPNVVNNALDCLASGTNCGSYKPDATWPGIGGAMTWSTNWDAGAGNPVSNTIGAHLHAMP